MVEDQIVARGIKDRKVVEAMKKIPREAFVREEDVRLAFYDGPLSIGFGQTISQPYIVAYMTDALRLDGTEKVLEIGTGSGYQTAVLAELASDVYTVEVVRELSKRAREILGRLGVGNVHFRIGNGWNGWPEEAPFDAIIVTAAPPFVPPALVDQLAGGGRMIVPVGDLEQHLELIEKLNGEIRTERLIGVRFVPMVGSSGED